MKCSALVTSLFALVACGAPPPDAGTATPASAGEVASGPPPLTCQGTHDAVDRGQGQVRLGFTREVWCLSAPSEGRFEAVVEIFNPGSEAAVIDHATIEKITPKPLEAPWLAAVGPLDKALEAELPVTIPAGQRAPLTLRSRFVLNADERDKSMRANVHVRFTGQAESSKQPIEQRFSIHVLTSDKMEQAGRGAPAWAEKEDDTPRGPGRGRGNPNRP